MPRRLGGAAHGRVLSQAASSDATSRRFRASLLSRPRRAPNNIRGLFAVVLVTRACRSLPHAAASVR